MPSSLPPSPILRAEEAKELLLPHSSAGQRDAADHLSQFPQHLSSHLREEEEEECYSLTQTTQRSQASGNQMCCTYPSVASFPGLHPSFCRLQYGKRFFTQCGKSCGVEPGNEANPSALQVFIQTAGSVTLIQLVFPEPLGPAMATRGWGCNRACRWAVASWKEGVGLSWCSRQQ